MTPGTMALSTQDLRRLLLCGVIGMGVSLGLITLLLLLRQGFGHALPDWDLRLGLALTLGTFLGFLLFVYQGLWQPLHQLLEALSLPRSHPSLVVLDRGIAPLQRLSHRVNALVIDLQSPLAARQQLLDGLAHDILGALTRLQLRVEALHEERQPRPDEVAGLKADLQALLELDQQLEALAVNAPPPREHKPVALDSLCRTLAQSYAPGSLLVAIPSCILKVDQQLLQRSLHNLIDNAIEYGSLPIVLSFQEGSNSIAIQVDDHGPVQSTMPNGRSPLTRLHRGLGLTIAENFCRQHGGNLGITRSSLGGLQVSLHMDKNVLVRSGP